MLSNWTKATTTTTGTGTLTLAAVTDRPLPSKSAVTGEYVQYSIVTSDSKYESGIGKIAASDTLERSKIFSTYNGTTYNSTTATALTLASGTHTVYITQLAEVAFEALRFPLSGPTNPVVTQTNISTSAANVAPAARERAIAYPFRLECSGIVTAMAVNCGVNGGTGSTTLLAMYEANNNGRPGRRLCKTSATLDTSSTGWKSQSVDANVRLTPGWYWAALVSQGGTGVPSFTGSACLKTAFGGSSVNLNLEYINENATATDLADPFPSTTLVYTYNNAPNNPAIGLVMS